MGVQGRLMTQKRKFSIFLENNLAPHAREAAYVYENPKDIISITDPGQVELGLSLMEKALSDGCHVAGWISYEAGLCLEKKLNSLVPAKLEVPLIYMGIFESRAILDTQSAEHYWQRESEKLGYNLSNLKLSQSREEYRDAFNKIQQYLSAGDIYQVNYTLKACFDFEGSARALYSALRNAQAVEFAAFMESEDLSVLSLSPELFVKKDGDLLVAKPMKGTGRRGRFSEEDECLAATLYNSEKDRAENLMIVDLLRNDLSKIAEPGSVEVSKLYEIEKYKTLFTMTSTINARAGQDISPTKLVRSIFPCGSVTGAPKIRAQQIINELEPHQRAIYTGAIGYFKPSGDMCLNVPIRTLTLDKKGKGELGIGGAIVADSVSEHEYDECLLKAEFLTKAHPRFDLIESIGWSKSSGFDQLGDHLDRLEKSADYFSFNFDRETSTRQLQEHAKYLDVGEEDRIKVRLLLSKTGSVSITSELVPKLDIANIQTIVISAKSVDRHEPEYFHKTTLRSLYDTELQAKRLETGCFDVVFTNDKGEITEGSFTNIFVKKDGILCTPKRKSGLLNGIYRERLLNDPDVKAREETLFVRDLYDAEQIFLCNSVRGLIEVELVKSDSNSSI